MATARETEKRILILYAIQSLKNRASKEDVLNFLVKKDLIILSNRDLEILSSRNEARWRNDFAYVRSHLVVEGYLHNEERGIWAITERGKAYYINEIKSKENTPLYVIKNFDLLKV